MTTKYSKQALIAKIYNDPAGFGSNTNKKVLGKFKDELGSLIISKFVALNPKVYSIMHEHFDKTTNTIEETNTKKCKGISKIVVKNALNHNDYVSVLKTNKPISREVVSIRSFNHQLYTYKQEKIALTSYYDKMNMIDGNTCLPYGFKM